MKIKNKSATETLEVINWLIDNVGEKMPGYSSGLRGYGWYIRYNEFSESYDIHLETDIIDEETQVMFMLTCA
jgi:hypothetical protein